MMKPLSNIIGIIGLFFIFNSSYAKDTNDLITAAPANKKGINNTVDISIKKFKFEPQELHIKVGQIVRWTNQEKRQYHSVWFEKNGEKESDYLFPDDVLDKKFNRVGVFPYFCGPHPEMTGLIIVD